MLAHFDPSMPNEIHTNASAVGVGAILIKKTNEQSRQWNTRAKRWMMRKRISATEPELYTTIFAAEKFEYYLSLTNVQKYHSPFRNKGSVKNQKSKVDDYQMNFGTKSVWFWGGLPTR